MEYEKELFWDQAFKAVTLHPLKSGKGYMGELRASVFLKEGYKEGTYDLSIVPHKFKKKEETHTASNGESTPF